MIANRLVADWKAIVEANSSPIGEQLQGICAEVVRHDRLEAEVRACHALILSLLYEQERLTVMVGSFDYCAGILESKPMGELIKVVRTGYAIQVQRADA